MFRAIEQTSVTNIVLIETIEIPLGLFLAWLLYREKSSWSAVIGAFLALGGVATTLWVQMGQPGEMMQQGQMRGGIGSGEIYATAGTFLLVLGAELGRKQLRSIPLGGFQRLPQFRRVQSSFLLSYSLCSDLNTLWIFSDPSSGVGWRCMGASLWLAVNSAGFRG